MLESEGFRRLFHDLHRGLHYGGDAQRKKIYGDQYGVRLDAAFRRGDDMTSQVIKAFDAEIKPTLSDYLRNRDKVIQAAWSFFFSAVKQLGNAG